MKEVAVAAGVSKATVSKVLSGKGSALRISPATQSHVRSVANQLGYVLGPIIRYRPAEIDDRLQTTDDRLQTTDDRLQTADDRLQTTDDSPKTAPVEAEPPPQDSAPVSPAVDPVVITPTPSEPPPIPLVDDDSTAPSFPAQ